MPTEKSMEIHIKSPCPQNPEICHTYILHTDSFSQMHIFAACNADLCCLYSISSICTVQYTVTLYMMYENYNA